MEKIIDKIRKLLTLARDEGATSAEAARAMELATKLMLEHGISEDQVNKSPVGLGSNFSEFSTSWEMYCVHAAATLYGTKPIIRNKVKVVFVGRAANIAATELTYEWLRDQIELAYKAALPKGMTKAERAEYRRSFKNSAAAVVYNRACEIVRTLKDKGTDQSTALVVLNHQQQLAAEADDFISQIQGLRQGRSRSVTLRATRGTYEGLAAGANIRLQQEVK